MTVVDPTTTDPRSPAQPVERNRRQVLCGLMVALVAPGVLAACGTSDTPGGTTTPAPGTTGGSTPTGGGATTGGGSTGALSTVAAIPDGGGVLVDSPSGGKVLLVRSGSTVAGFDPSCPHQGATVDPPKDGVITCPRHFSTFNATTGARISGQAQTGLKTVAVKVDGDSVVLA
ncbi:Rieske (2Fe-2S) protein [Actinokineospora terrae]|uniref:Ferredoxin subunit of nitrite reductase or a ring-hydroxylating dioxygenase n=1 Tax=Actinokineospora terrae TaxID=155974 RepID=A0A1H9V8H4_9PSEU|nr:Rieske (2Fe-2S) protein [Actinokineospora terrae]SES17985.1 Ferredoxin subunit of nitrite reductase or a ring-hydroxylating dioxygenase [Actinokineospora terrae]